MSNLPRCEKSDNAITGSKNAVDCMERMAGLLTTLSVEADKRDLISMRLLLMDLSNRLCDCTDAVNSLIRCVEKHQEFIDKEKKNNSKL